MTAAAFIGLALIVSVAAVVLLTMYAQKLKRASRALAKEHADFRQRFSGVIDAEEERRRVLEEFEEQRMQLRNDAVREQSEAARVIDAIRQRHNAEALELDGLQTRVRALRTEFESLDEQANLQAFGFYKPRYAFATSAHYEERLEAVREQQKRMLKDKTAAVCPVEWQVNGSRTEGRKQVNQTLKLMLRAFNGESDASIAKVKYNNVGVMEARIRKAWDAINDLAGVQKSRITDAYLDLKLQELFLVHEHQEKLHEEKEEQRRIRERMRDEEIAQRQLEKARQEAEREEGRYGQALEKARAEVERATGAKQQKLVSQIEELKRRLDEAHANKERAIARAQMTRSGHVYIISNVGSFGENVYKIGMTRRLDPLERDPGTRGCVRAVRLRRPRGDLLR